VIQSCSSDSQQHHMIAANSQAVCKQDIEAGPSCSDKTSTT